MEQKLGGLQGLRTKFRVQEGSGGRLGSVRQLPVLGNDSEEESGPQLIEVFS